MAPSAPQWLERGVSLARYTTFRIGGPAGLFYKATDTEGLLRALRWAWGEGVPWLVLGGGSNVLVADEGFPGLVVVNACSGVEAAVRGERVLVRVAGGTPLSLLARKAVGEGWAGLEWAAGIPGTVAGAVVGNAGAFGGSMAEVVRRVRVALPDGTVQWLSASELDFGYRTSVFKSGALKGRGVILEVELELAQGDPFELWGAFRRNLEQRRLRQPSEPSAGSVFKNPPGDFAARLIEAAGLKGFRVGDAMFSPRHANFIVNAGRAKASDVLELIRLARRRVLDLFGIELELEIELVGF